MLIKYLSYEKEEENDSAAQSGQQVGSAQNEPENSNPVSDASLLEEESPSSPKFTNSLVFDGKNWVLSLDSQDLDKEQFNPRIMSSPLPG